MHPELRSLEILSQRTWEGAGDLTCSELPKCRGRGMGMGWGLEATP